MSSENPGQRRQRWEIVPPILVVVTASLALLRIVSPETLEAMKLRVGLSSASIQPEPPLPVEPVLLAGLWTKGSYSAPAGMILFEDYQCPASSHFETTSLPRIESKYVSSGRLLLAVWHRPLPQHERAVDAAAAAECAGKDGKFWEMRNTLFRNQQRFADSELAAFAREFSVRDFGACVKDTSTTGRITDSLNSARAFKVNSTPTVFLGTMDGNRLRVTTRWSGSRPFEAVSRAIDDLLAGAR